MVQRAGRIDRIGTAFDRLLIYNMFPDEGLERLLRLVESLSEKIAAIDVTGFLDASILGEAVHPRNFNTLRRIRDEDGSVIEEEEQFTELASNEFLLKQLRELLASGAREALEEIPYGIHSGLARPGARGVFFYFQGRPADGETLHFWKYADLRGNAASDSALLRIGLSTRSRRPAHSSLGRDDREESSEIIDNRYLIANLIACERDTLRVVDPELFRTVFDLQEQVIANILSSIEEQRARSAAPRSLDPIQQTVATAIQSYLSHPDVDRAAAVEAIKFVSRPMRRTQVTRLRQAFREFQRASTIGALLEAIAEIRSQFGELSGVLPPPGQKPAPVLSRDHLQLICLDLVSG